MVEQLVLGILAVAVIVGAPIALLSFLDRRRGAAKEAYLRWKEARHESVDHWRRIRALRKQQGVPIEDVAATLRRLRKVIATDQQRSAAHQFGSRLAYDKVLIQACEMLSIEHDLETGSMGLDGDIERIRIEAELERAGVVLSDRRFGQAA
jgi:hypothetical protein